VGILYINRKGRRQSESGYTIRIHSPKALSCEVGCLEKSRETTKVITTINYLKGREQVLQTSLEAVNLKQRKNEGKREVL
jgi:hypothetical protein